MALHKAVELATGVVVNYHRINRLHVQYLEDNQVRGQMEVGSYLDQAARAAGKQPASVMSFDLTLTGDINRAIAYDWLKQPMTKEPVYGYAPFGGEPGATQKVLMHYKTIGVDTGLNDATDA